MSLDLPKIDTHFDEKDIPFKAPSLFTGTRENGDTSGKKPFISTGQHIHKWGTYLSVDWIFNAMTGVTFAYWGKFTESGKKIWSEPITNAFKKGLGPLIKNEEQLAKSAAYGNVFMSIIAGGMFTIPPLLVLENKKNKKNITQALDEKIYGKETVENDPRFQASYEAIENAPEKDFTRGLTSRFAALAPLLAMVLIPATRKISDKLWFDHVAHASDVTARKMGFSPESFKNLPAAEAAGRWDFIHKSVAMDAGLGVPYAILHAFFYNKFVGNKEKKEHKNDTPILANDVQKIEKVIDTQTPAVHKENPHTMVHPQSVTHAAQPLQMGAQG